MGFIFVYRQSVAANQVTDSEILLFELQDVVYIAFLFLPVLLSLFIIANSKDNTVFIFLFGDMKKYFLYKMIHIGVVAVYVSFITSICVAIVLKSDWEYQLLFSVIIFLFSFQVCFSFSCLEVFGKIMF